MTKTLQRIVVPTDGSAAAFQAGELAIRLALAHGSQIYFCQVVDPIVAVEGGMIAIEVLKRAAQENLRVAVQAAEARGVPATQELLMGSPVNAIAWFVDAREADAVVIGANGKRRLERFLFGSTTEGVLRRTHIPVFVTRDTLPTASPSSPVFARILIAIDDSEPSAAAARFAAALAAEEGSRLTLCHVLNQASEQGLSYHQARSLLDDASAEARARGVQDVTTRVVAGEPVSELLKMATAHGVRLIAIGTHGRRGFTRLLLGSVAESIMRQSPVPVLALQAGIQRAYLPARQIHDHPSHDSTA